MPFTQGREKTGGRNKNQPNKISKNIRLASAMLLEGQIEVLAELLPKLKPSEYLKALQMLYKVAVPQQRQIEVDTIEHPTEFKIEIIETLKGYSDAELDTAIDTHVKNLKG
jgi:hypothetical protein